MHAIGVRLLRTGVSKVGSMEEALFMVAEALEDDEGLELLGLGLL